MCNCIADFLPFNLETPFAASDIHRGGSRAAATSKMECFVIIVTASSRYLLSQSAPSCMLQQP